MTAGIATLKICNETGFYDSIEKKSHLLVDGVAQAAQGAGVELQTGATGGMFGFTLSSSPIRNFDDAKGGDHAAYGRFFHAMLNRGVWLPPSGYEAMFMSAAHTEEHIDRVIAAAREAFAEIAS